jgi:hypothetical protein
MPRKGSASLVYFVLGLRILLSFNEPLYLLKKKNRFSFFFFSFFLFFSYNKMVRVWKCFSPLRVVSIEGVR